MAININNHLTWSYKGKVGKDFVLKDIKGKTFLTKYPDRSGVVLSVSQQKGNGLFQQAVAHAQAIIRDPERKAELKEKLKSRKKTAHQAPYHAAIQEFMRANSPKARMAGAEEILGRYIRSFLLTERQVEALKYLALGEQLSNAVYQNLNKVSKATATRDLQDMVSRGIIQASGRGAGAKYILLPLASEDEQ